MTKVIRKKQPSTKESTNIILLQKLQNAVNKKVFLRDDISLVELASRLGTNRTYLSDLVHVNYNMSFSDFINKLRIEEGMKLMREKNGDVMIRELYKELGFTSSTTFFRSFKKVTGMTTGQWINKMLMEQQH